MDPSKKEQVAVVRFHPGKDPEGDLKTHNQESDPSESNMSSATVTEKTGSTRLQTSRYFVCHQISTKVNNQA